MTEICPHRWVQSFNTRQISESTQLELCESISIVLLWIFNNIHSFLIAWLSSLFQVNYKMQMNFRRMFNDRKHHKRSKRGASNKVEYA